ncbi:unnamed protein product [Symbiodinium microadriaticum]|nr:unnamed protein product [Symbiodinium sp. KB8]CAE7212436.1 unnamed protein product [Symbiodinium microadriaticum]
MTLSSRNRSLFVRRAWIHSSSWPLCFHRCASSCSVRSCSAGTSAVKRRHRRTPVGQRRLWCLARTAPRRARTISMCRTFLLEAKSTGATWSFKWALETTR